jgi:hypothetical protein
MISFRLMQGYAALNGKAYGSGCTLQVLFKIQGGADCDGEKFAARIEWPQVHQEITLPQNFHQLCNTTELYK